MKKLLLTIYIALSFAMVNVFAMMKVSRKIVPFNGKNQHIALLAACAGESFGSLFSNSPNCPFRQSLESRIEFGLTQAYHLSTQSNKDGQIKNSNGSVTTTKVIEENGNPAGFIMFTAPLTTFKYKELDTGGINHVAVLQEYRGKGLGKALMKDTCFDLLNNHLDLRFIVLTTRGKIVGEKFFTPLGFSLLAQFTSKDYPDEIVYFWEKELP